MKIKINIVLLLASLLFFKTWAQKPVELKSENKLFKTYMFSEPNPTLPTGRFFPYFRFDGFTDQGVDKAWKSIELSNEFITLRILPEIGGKIWGAFYKKTGFPYIYHNDVVKFRDVSARGPWTSGGVEFNFGDFGHAPSCATPVDYATEQNQDGSVSCYLGTYDWSSRSNWVVEVKLEPNKSYFTTRSVWQNNQPLHSTNYQWMNAGFRASDDLEFLYPGTHYIDHDGNAYSWPKHKNGKNLNFYKENDFGTYKSYHVLGTPTDYFGAHWHTAKTGFIHYSPFHQKIGKKLWIWGLSREGMIWENLLTDTNGQYVELQSGRFYNQAAPSSYPSPYKYNLIEALQNDEFTERWAAFYSDKKVLTAFKSGTISYDDAHLYVYANEDFKANFLIEKSDKSNEIVDFIIKADEVKVLPLATSQLSKITWNGKIIFDKNETTVNKPLAAEKTKILENAANDDFQKALAEIGQRNYKDAHEILVKFIAKSPNHIEALVELAQIKIRKGQMAEALALCNKALAIHNYHGKANFYQGYINLMQGHLTDAADRFAVVSLQNDTKNLGLTYLAITFYKQGNMAQAKEVIDECLRYFPQNTEMQNLKIITHRNNEKYGQLLDNALKINPLDYFAYCEKHLINHTANDPKIINNELPHENYLELALWYDKIGLTHDALKILGKSPKHIMVDVYTIYFQSKLNQNAFQAIEGLNQASVEFAFPHRHEDFEILQNVLDLTKNSKVKYLQALLNYSKHNYTEATKLIDEISDIEIPSFYLNKALIHQLNKAKSNQILAQGYSKHADNQLLKRVFINSCLGTGQNKKALELASDYTKGPKEDYKMGQLYAKALFNNQKFDEVVSVLTVLKCLPNEGASDMYSLYRQACLLAALNSWKQQKPTSITKQLLDKADEYPENLGSGKPYDTDTKTTDGLRKLINSQKNNLSKTGQISAIDFAKYLKMNTLKEKDSFIMSLFTK